MRLGECLQPKTLLAYNPDVVIVAKLSDQGLFTIDSEARFMWGETEGYELVCSVADGRGWIAEADNDPAVLIELINSIRSET